MPAMSVDHTAGQAREILGARAVQMGEGSRLDAKFHTLKCGLRGGEGAVQRCEATGIN